MKDIKETHPNLFRDILHYFYPCSSGTIELIKKHTIEKEVLKEKINEFLKRIDKKVIHYPEWRETCPTCFHSINDYNNRDKLFSKTVLSELLKELIGDEE